MDIINETHTGNQRHRKQEPQILKPEDRAPNPQRQQENNPPPLRTIDECDERSLGLSMILNLSATLK